MNLLFYNEQKTLDIDQAFVEQLARCVFHTMGTALPDALALHLVDKEKIAHLHAEYFGDPSPTDTISFPINAIDDAECGYLLLGEIFVCPQVALEYAAEHHSSPIEECSLYIIHGILHLLGYEDREESARQKMREAEMLCLESFFKDRAM